MNANLYALFESHFPADKSACCIETHDGLIYSWRDLDHATARIANLLVSLKLPKDARVAVQVEKSPEALILYLATIRAGYVYLPLNTAYRAAEIEYFIADAEPAVVVCSPLNFGWVSKIAFKADVKHVFTLSEDRHGSLLARATHHADRFETAIKQSDDLAAILYTSGTTGRSKGAMLTHHNLASNAKVLQDYWQWQPGDVLLHTLPLFHVHGLFVASHGALLNGSKMIFLPRFDSAQVVRYLSHSTIFMGVPTYYVRLLAEPSFDQTVCTKMRLFVSGSAPLLIDTFNKFTRCTGHTILERYGMSETTMLASNPCDGKRVGGTVGLPLSGISIRVVKENADHDPVPCNIDEIGEIQASGPNVFKGYWRMPDKTAEEFTVDGYFKTGDVGKFDKDGYLSIVGRSKDLIISGGYNVYPKEIESFIDEINGIVESAVIGIPHSDYGEAVIAVVVAKPDARLSEQQIIAALKGKIANFKVPKRIFFSSELPRNTMGKIQKNLLRDRFSQA
ncbi:MAG TPA: malonyl-CoA synthase [Paucimonas sp.]|nr:malonyl-CoA synthase [Paucimonas sp.]HJW57044.1 malonyl-CoA synthase [Burkholderiaceae bacterium]